MRIQTQQNTTAQAAHVAQATPKTYKTQNIVEGGLAPEAVSLMARDRFVPVVKAPMPVIIAAPAAPAPNPPAQQGNGVDWAGVAAWAFNPFKLHQAVGAVGQAIGNAVVGAIQGVASWLGGLFKGPEPQPELARPVDVTIKVLPDDAARQRLGKVYDVLDENADGQLAGEELHQNQLFVFDAAKDGGKTRDQFIGEAFVLEGSVGVTLTVEAAVANSPRGRIAALMNEVWGTPELFNDASYKWWKGQLKLVGGDYDRLKDKMEAYKKSIERA